MSVVIGLTRHFETDWNADGRMQGRTDRPLTPAARARAGALRLPAAWVDARLIATPLIRSKETAQLLTGRAPEIEPALIELSWGAWEGRRGVDLIDEPASGFGHVETWGWEKRPPGGESPADAWARIAPALRRVADAGQPALMVLHRGVMRVIMAKAWDWHFDRLEPFRIKRERIYPITLDDEGAPVGHGPEARLAPR